MRFRITSIVALFVLVSATSLAAAAQEGGAKTVAPDCTFNGKRLYGKVKYVTAFPDVKVQVVSAFPDLKVKKVKALADECGEWEETDGIPDFTVQLVQAFPDVKVQFVEAFPGLP